MKLTIFTRPLRGFFPALTGLVLSVVEALALSACSVLLPTPTSTPTPAPTGSPTATIVWFPATSTPTPFPTLQASPTVDYRPGLGDLLFTDNFSDPTLWNTAVSDLASATISRNQLILTVSGQGLSIVSLRSLPALDDFYAEVTVDLNLCRADDEYGVLFRAAPGQNDYRLEVNCSGQVRLIRERGASITTLQDWLSSGDAPQGGPAQVKLGMWAAGEELRVFLNDDFQFSTRDRYFRTGSLGFFASSGGTTPVLATFSNLAVYSVNYVPPPPTPLPSRTPHK